MVFVVLSAEFAYLMANEMCYYEQTPMESTKLSPSIYCELTPMYRREIPTNNVQIYIQNYLRNIH